MSTCRESTRFGGLMAYSYMREKLCHAEEVLGRGLGKEAEGRTNNRVRVFNRHPLAATRVISPPCRMNVSCSYAVKAFGLAFRLWLRDADEGARGVGEKEV
jgi:hypothetical protein